MRNWGLIKVDYVRGTVSARVTRDPREWITQEGWEAMGMTGDGDPANAN